MGGRDRVVTGATTRVLYVAGNGRSGSTLLGRLLGQVPGFFDGGELRYVWERGFLEDGWCGCGSTFSRCPTWRAVVDEMLLDADDVDLGRVAGAQRRWSRTRHLPGLLHARRTGRLDVRLGQSVEHLARLYRAVSTTTGCQVVVDSSKLPGYAMALEVVPSVELFVVHLVRDARGSAYSWSKVQSRQDRGVLRAVSRQRPGRASLLWNLENAACERLAKANPERYLRLRYEDLVSEPRRWLTEMCALVNEAPVSFPFLAPDRATIAATHSVAGNPSRMTVGDVGLEADIEWRSRMGTFDKVLVSALTAPWLARYGYPLRPGPSQRSPLAAQAIRGS